MAGRRKVKEDSWLLGTALLEGTALWRFPQCKQESGTFRGEETVMFWDIFQPIVIEESDTDTTHVIKAGEVGRLDLIAYRYYENPRLGWVIAQVNHLLNPIDEMFPGGILKIPHRNSVVGALQTAVSRARFRASRV